MAVTDDVYQDGAQDRPERFVPVPVGRREAWGYGVWLLTGLAIATPELWAIAGDPPWPTISATVAHLEARWAVAKIIVVALITSSAVQLLTYPPTRSRQRLSGGRPRRRTQTGRLTKAVDTTPSEIAYAASYFPLAALLIIAAAAATAAASTDTYVVGYVLYGLMALALLVVPNALAYRWAKEVPFPTLFRTLADLHARFQPALLIVCSGLAVLVVHIVAYPWP